MIVKVILEIFMGASAQHDKHRQDIPRESKPFNELFSFVFVFTLDCNNRIYCYDTDDDT